VGRDVTAGIFNQQIVATAFSVDENAPFQSRVGDQRTHAVAVVSGIIAPDTSTIGTQLGDALQLEISDDAQNAFQTGLLGSYEIKTDQRLVDIALGRVDPTQQ
jgi:hypothetical protein